MSERALYVNAWLVELDGQAFIFLARDGDVMIATYFNPADGWIVTRYDLRAAFQCWIVKP